MTRIHFRPTMQFKTIVVEPSELRPPSKDQIPVHNCGGASVYHCKNAIKSILIPLMKKKFHLTSLIQKYVYTNYFTLRYNFGWKTSIFGKIVIQNWDHLHIKSFSAGPIVGFNCEVLLYITTWTT